MDISESKWPDRALWIGILVFVLALELRILFLLSIADTAGPYNPYYTGDTPAWLQDANAIRSSQPFDLGLPLRPPGVAYLTAALWNGQESGLFFLSLAWSFMGAGVVVLFFAAVLRSFDLRVASVAAIIAAASTGLIILSTSVNNEIPYLLLLMTGFTLWEPIRHRPRLRVLILWSIVQGLACLIRAEHVLFFGLTSAWLMWAWTHLPGPHGTWKRNLGRGACMLVFFALPLIPWQLHIAGQIRQFNQRPLPVNPATEQAYTRLERGLSALHWTDGATRESLALPAFCRRTLSNFVATTVAMRDRLEVTAADFGIIDEAFGYRPEPLAECPFIALYGGLNFYLANNPLARGGFSPAPLEAAPPLAGGPSRYPAFLISGLPPPELALSYPPHLHIVNHGYLLGLNWIRSHPGDYSALALRKMRIFWSGVTMGVTGYNLPLGISGLRRAVDMVVPDEAAGVTLWRWAGLAILLAGIWLGRREEALVPWLLLLSTKAVTTLAFFGYAREGAVVIPVFALLLALAAARGAGRFPWFRARPNAAVSVRRWTAITFVAAVILVAVEGVRWISAPVVTLNGRQVEAAGTASGGEYHDVRVQVK